MYLRARIERRVRRSDAGRNDVFWMAEHDAGSDPSVAVSRFLLGNGVTTERIASRATGRVRDIASGVRGGFGLQQIEYDYDVLGNVKTRTDAATGLVENAFYDALNRLDGFVSTLGANVTNTDVDYAANGNITWKSDVGAYAYGAGGAGPHAVTSAGAHTYTYDANGGMLTGAGRAIQWTAFNQFRRIDQGGQFSEFWFGAAHERVGQRNNHGRTVYVGGIYERFTPTGSGPTEHRHWITTPAGRIAVHKTFSTGAPKTDYFHHDALGSITVVTNEKGVKVERFRYDAWGNRLDGSGQPVLWANNAGITRGFTDHEHLDDLGLVHMNGRVYDPVLARFLSADPFIDGVSDSPGFNRYTYVHNNPLNATDPSGFLSFKDVLKIVAIVVVAYFTAGWGIAALGPSISAGFGVSAAVGAGIGGGLAGGFASGFAASLLNGGSIGDAFQAGLVGGIVGAVSGGIAGWIGDLAEKVTWFGDVKWAAHGLSQGLITEATGGEFRHGFYAAAFTSLMEGPISSVGRDFGDAGEFAAAAVVGGTASVLGGGKFANGAASGVFTYLFNARQHRERDWGEVSLDSYEVEIGSSGFPPESRALLETAAALVDAGDIDGLTTFIEGGGVSRIAQGLFLDQFSSVMTGKKFFEAAAGAEIRHLIGVLERSGPYYRAQVRFSMSVYVGKRGIFGTSLFAKEMWMPLGADRGSGIWHEVPGLYLREGAARAAAFDFTRSQFLRQERLWLSLGRIKR
ncbi:hypothetical protein ASA1KI_30200 [Opitutales bacterium ASA1]|uniref:RHS repeat-associated core domain-containing protein n=1 Tax=Congregicoccus parvus TaxID=3081749 RepID=UPI002B2FA109|nr:hypothetical protein ASA1KI_30200 [Opitutales bacterium ASA1]